MPLSARPKSKHPGAWSSPPSSLPVRSLRRHGDRFEQNDVDGGAAGIRRHLPSQDVNFVAKGDRLEAGIALPAKDFLSRRIHQPMSPVRGSAAPAG